MMRSFRLDHLSYLLFYALSFLLLWEWIRPIGQLTNTGSLFYFLLFAGLSLLLYFLRVDWRISAVVKLIFIVFCLQRIHFNEPGADGWFGPLLSTIWDSLILTIQQSWGSVSDPYRSFLFFILLWLTTYLIHYWISVRKQLFIFYVFTVIFVTLLDTFTPYDGQVAIIRIILIGFTLMGLLTLQRVLDQERVEKSAGTYRKWIIPLAGMIVFSSAIAYAAPKAAPIWPDPVPFIQSFSEGAGTGGTSRIGYGTDDSSLGGPFVGDDTKVFDVVTSDDQYWRIETKDLYTGKGWENSEQAIGDGPSFENDETVPLQISTVGNDVEEQTASIEISLAYSHVVYPYNPTSVTSEDAESYTLDSVNEKIISYAQEEPTQLPSYEWTFKEPTYSLTALRETFGAEELAGTPMLEQYLQLPDGLPDRVRELAVEITENEDNWYDKARAVERYFSQSGFRYSQTDVGVPEGDQDYVDQFLFETQVGYCDNFSTSMVVLLRSVDIPARWVKGYTEGEQVGTADNGLAQYEVTNNNAHSWVEVYFPSLGWVPFEPTIGFSNALSLDFDLETDSDTEETTPAAGDETETPETPEPQQPEEQDGAVAQEELNASNFVSEGRAFIDSYRTTLIVGGLVLLAALVLLYRFRSRWLPYVLVAYYRRRADRDFDKAYASLLKQLERYGLTRKEQQTLRAYAKEIDTFFGSSEMSRLTQKYERMLYRQEEQNDQWEDMRELWENLIKRTTG